jgi:hypothetical protein
MNELLQPTAAIKQTHGLTLILTPDKARNGQTDLIAGLLLNDPLFIVAGGEWLPAFNLPRILRGRTLQIKHLTDRLRTARAATCYRLLDSLSNLPTQGEPLLVLDLLHTFFDPNVRLTFRFRVLRQCCDHLKRLASYRSVIVVMQELPLAEYEKFLPIVSSVAKKILTIEPEPIQALQPALF